MFKVASNFFPQNNHIEFVKPIPGLFLHFPVKHQSNATGSDGMFCVYQWHWKSLQVLFFSHSHSQLLPDFLPLCITSHTLFPSISSLYLKKKKNLLKPLLFLLVSCKIAIVYSLSGSQHFLKTCRSHRCRAQGRVCCSSSGTATTCHRHSFMPEQHILSKWRKLHILTALPVWVTTGHVLATWSCFAHLSASCFQPLWVFAEGKKKYQQQKLPTTKLPLFQKVPSVLECKHVLY